MKWLVRILSMTLLIVEGSFMAVADYSDIIISEYCAVNDSIVADETGAHPDWIELYNSGAEAVNLSGMYLTDNPSNTLKYQLTGNDLVLQPGSFIVLWADDKPFLGSRHLEFRLSSGETIIISSPASAYIDSAKIDAVFADISVGRIDSYPGNNWAYFDNPTPGSPNSGNYYLSVCKSPVFSIQSGFYSNAFQVEISTTGENCRLYYTVNGHDPVPEDTGTYLYGNTPVNISQTTVLRALSVNDDCMPSPISSTVYFFGENPSLPVIATITDPDNLFGPEGIYAHPWNEGYAWERFSQHYFFRSGQSVYCANSGLRIQGGNSVGMAKKSFRQHYRDQYGNDRLDYPLFAQNGIASYKRIVLRAGYDDDITTSSGTLLRDPLSAEIWKKLGSLASSSDWAVLYLNGSYWGIYNLRESIDEDFFTDHLGTENIDVIRYLKEGPVLVYGSVNEWNKLETFFDTTDFTRDESYYAACEIIDMDNFLNLLAFVHCSQFRSWTWGSFAYKERKAGSKWRWTIWDTDRSYENLAWNGFTDYAYTANEKWSNFMPKELIKNKLFKRKLINRTADLINSVFRPENSIGICDSLKSIIEPEMQNEKARWNPGSNWSTNVQSVKNFLNNRPAVVRNQIKSYFALPSEHTINLNIEGSGLICINSLKISSFPWSGIYFEDVPVYLKAIPAKGYKFTGWSNGMTGNVIPAYSLAGDSTITATFIEDTETGNPVIVINEIMYHSASSSFSDDWIELYNNGSSADLSGWWITDENASNKFTIPQETYLPADNYLVLIRNTGQFEMINHEQVQTTGDFNFGLSGSGDCVKLYNTDGLLIDSVCYDDNYPWPEIADGYGPSIQLTAPGLDNSLPYNWESSLYPLCTPGELNKISYTPSDIGNFENEAEEKLNIRVYPVPAKEIVYLSFELTKPEIVNVHVSNTNGQVVYSQLNLQFSEGKNTIELNIKDLSPGVYYIRLTTKTGIITKKITRLK